MSNKMHAFIEETLLHIQRRHLKKILNEPFNYYQKGYSSILVFLLTGFGILITLSVAAAAGFEGLPGPYCATRRDPCCQGRLDDCSVRVFDTYCYCDEFCNRTRSDDCCPDYWSFCLNIRAPEPLDRCYAGGRYYNYGDEVKINCNKCKCTNVGSRVELSCEQNSCLIDDTVINDLNRDRNLGWRASNYSAFWGKTLNEGIVYRTGTLEPHRTVKSMQPVLVKDPQPLPLSFDGRFKWPGLISDPADQGWCGASWAMSTVAVASDRFGIMSGGIETVRLSPQQLLSCNDRGQQGCQGGHLTRAWKYMRKYGLVDEDCYPWQGGQAGKCRLPRRTTLQGAGCTQRSSQRFRTELYKVGPVYRIQGERDIMHEIMASGPVQATMKVYQDFFSYKSGIYKKSYSGNGDSFGYHSVRIIGWGEDRDILGRPTKYWLAINSWGPYWGENGMFKIVRGSNECNIEEFVLASWSKTARPQPFSNVGRNNEPNVINN